MDGPDSTAGKGWGKVAIMGFSRAGVRTVLTWAVGLIVGVFVAEWLIALLAEQGYYASPSSRMRAAMSAISTFLDMPIVQWIAAFSIGLVTGLWLDIIMRRREAKLGQARVGEDESDETSELIIDSSFRAALEDRQTELIAYFDRLLAKVGDAEASFREGKSSQQEFDDAMFEIKALRNGGIFNYIDETMVAASKLIDDGEKKLSHFKSMIYRNFSPGGRYLSTDHAMLNATLEKNKELTTQIITEALFTIDRRRDEIIRRLYQEKAI